ncbi:TIGR03013 family XrtA/PEP-CTERM system glycosyltransferase [Oxalobacteraceae bacterium A2-2]
MIRIFHHYVSKLGFGLLLLELSILLAAGMLTARHGDPMLGAGAFALVLVLCMSALGMYRPGSRAALRYSLLRILPAFLLGFLLLYAARQGGVGGAAFALGACGVMATRLLLCTSARSGVMRQRLLLVGDGAIARECLELATGGQGFHQFQVVGCVPVAGESCCVPPVLLLPAGLPIRALARRLAADEIVVSVSDRRNGAFPQRQLLECALDGIRITDVAAFFEREACQIRIDALQPSFLIFGGGFDQSWLRASVKRAFDLAASAAIGLLTLPVMLVTALLVRAGDGGPVFYQQERVGKNGCLFKVLKFRSMRVDAERGGQPQWAAADDPRVTRVGRWIRLLRIDELPQMLNVFKGEMSFVGPRPERVHFVRQLGHEVDYYNVRHTIKPGITGLAQVRYQYGASVADAVRKLQYDLYYVKNHSLFLDLLILLETVQVVLLGKGSR